ncbi:UNVERIFIED_CONTAM: copper amine oxidase-like protein [Acetivibrio alkalicellulosi]
MSKSGLLKFGSTFLIFAAFTVLFYTGSINVNANTTEGIVTSDFVDLKFTINNKRYISKMATKEMDIAPTIVNGRTLVPFRTIFEELGYDVRWDDSSKSITATRQGSIINLQINNERASVNGNRVQLDVAPTIEQSRTLVPLRFVAESSGAFVDWNAEEKSITINRIGQFDTGTILFYDQRGRNPQVYVYDGKSIVSIPLDGREIKNTITYNGGLLITLFDSANDTNNLVTYRNGKFETLISNFEIKEQIEFNDNLILHGYDRTRKMDSIYRFDGKDMHLIAENFAMGKYVFFKDQLIVNRYTDNRAYSLVAFNKSSWTPELLRNDYILQDSLIQDDILFMSCIQSTGNNKPFISYDGRIRILHQNLDVDLSRTTNFTESNGVNTILTVTRNHFIALRNSRSNPNQYDVFDLFLPSSVSERRTVNVSGVTDYNGLIYLAIRDTHSIVTANGFSVISLPDNVRANNTFTQKNYLQLNVNSYFKKDCTFLSFNATGDNLLIHLQDRDSKDYMLYVLDKSKESLIRDVTKINDIKSIGNKTFLAVEDIDRITNSKRFALILYDKSIANENARVRNLVLGLETKMWEELSGSLAVSGREADIKRSKVYLYSNEFKELLSNFEVNYWNKIDDKIFTSGRDTDSRTVSFNRIDANNTKLLKDNFSVEKVIKAKGDYYIVYATEQTPSTPYSNKKILYIYNDRTNEFIDLAIDIQLTDLIFVN